MILHIGASKTGTSAIQSFLALNADKLRRGGYIVPDIALGLDGEIEGHQVWAFEQAQCDPRAALERLRLLINAAETRFSADATLVLSAENLANNNGCHLLFKSIANQIPIDLVLYIRRQDEYLISAWQQWYSKVHPDMSAWIFSEIGSLGNWRHCLQQWETVVPQENIRVRVFERERLVGGDAITDFLDVTRIGVGTAGFSMPTKVVNPIFTEAVLRMAHESPALFRDAHDNDFYDMLRDLTGDQFLKRPNESVFTHAQRAGIVQAYKEANNWVKDRYCPAFEGSLFRDVYKDDYLILSQELIDREKWQIVLSMLHGLYKRILQV
jgi:hypothetical protein